MVEQELVEAYFESNGFLVRQAGGSSVGDARRKLDPLPVLAVMNPRADQNNLHSETRLFSADLNRIRAAVVGVLGWSNSPFSPAVMSSDSRQLKFLKQQLDKERVEDCLNPGPQLAESGMGSFLRLLVVPALPLQGEKMKEAIALIESLGVDGVLTLRSILENLLRQALPGKGREGRWMFQILRLIKAYGLARDPQIEIFNTSD